MLDLGGGTGHHLAAVLDRAPDAVGVVLDSSAYAARRAARAHPRALAVVADSWAGGRSGTPSWTGCSSSSRRERPESGAGAAAGRPVGRRRRRPPRRAGRTPGAAPRRPGQGRAPHRDARAEPVANRPPAGAGARAGPPSRPWWAWARTPATWLPTGSPRLGGAAGAGPRGRSPWTSLPTSPDAVDPAHRSRSGDDDGPSGAPAERLRVADKRTSKLPPVTIGTGAHRESPEPRSGREGFEAWNLLRTTDHKTIG